MASTGGMLLVIKGIASRVSSAVNDWVFGMKETGMGDSKVKMRLIEDLEASRITNEMLKFAQVRIPGYVGELTNRFARDTLSDEYKRQQQNAQQAEAIIAGLHKKGNENTQDVEDVVKTWEKQGIDTSAWEEGQLPSVPPSADLNDLYTWIAIEDKNTCEVCDANHGETKTLKEWAEIGEPRSGACAGEQRCRCLLVLADTINPDDIPETIKIAR